MTILFVEQDIFSMETRGIILRGMKTGGLRPAREKEKAPRLRDEAGGPGKEDRRRAALPRSWA